MPTNNEKNIDFALDTARQKLAFQARATQALDTKTGILIGFVSVVAANLLLLIKDKPDLVGVNLFGLGLLVLLYALWNLVQATWTKDYLDPPDFDTFYSEDALAKDNTKLKNQVVADIKKSYEHNHTNDKDRAAAFDRSVWALATSIILLVTGVLT